MSKKNNRTISSLTGKFISYIVIIGLVMGMISLNTVQAAVTLKGDNITVETASGESFNVRTLLVSDGFERYISLSDMSVVLRSTSKPFTVSYSGSDVTIQKGAATDRNSTGTFSAEDAAVSRKLNPPSGAITVNGSETSYSCIMDDLGGGKDCYMRMTDFVMMADIYMNYDGVWHADADKGFHVTVDELLESGYFEAIDAALIGDATTGDIFFDYEGDTVLEIASTTKLITYAVIKDALTNGEIHESDMVTISENVSRLSKSEDGVIEYETGKQVPVSELIIAILLPSSNESALAMAEHICGSEAAFVDRMRAKLEEIGVYDATLFNCHGLPVFTDGAVIAKNQNRLSARDMFSVVCHIMEYYPEITEITSMKNADLEVAGAFVKNTNGVLKNLPNCNGLKTGTTTKAGACLVASCNDTNASGEEHTLVAIIYGAENNAARVSYGELLLRLAMQEFKEGPSVTGTSGISSADNTVDPNKLLNKIMKNARSKGLIE